MTCRVPVMILGPPLAPAVMLVRPSFTRIVGDMLESGRFPRFGEIPVRLPKPEEIGLSGNGGEVVHLVVQDDSEPRHGEEGTETAVDGLGARDGHAIGVDDAEMARAGVAEQVGRATRFDHATRLGRHDRVEVDPVGGRFDGGGVQERIHRNVDEVRIGEMPGAIRERVPHRLGEQV